MMECQFKRMHDDHRLKTILEVIVKYRTKVSYDARLTVHIFIGKDEAARFASEGKMISLKKNLNSVRKAI